MKWFLPSDGKANVLRMDPSNDENQQSTIVSSTMSLPFYAITILLLVIQSVVFTVVYMCESTYLSLSTT